MPRICSICTHPDRVAIDRALIAGEPIPAIAARYSTVRCTIGRMALQRHKEAHLPATLNKAHAADEVARADDLLAEARRLKDITMGLLGRAVQANDLRTALAAVREARGNLELIGRLLGELDAGPAVNVLVAPEWVAVRSTVLAALGPYPESRAAVAAHLMALETSNGHR